MILKSAIEYAGVKFIVRTTQILACLKLHLGFLPTSKCNNGNDQRRCQYLFQMLYLQDLVDQKLQKESHLRNLIAHMASFIQDLISEETLLLCCEILYGAMQP
jgi:hypothetical protein